MAHFRQFSSATGSFSYLLADMEKREAVLIDPDDAQVSLYAGVLEELQVRLEAILFTHVHAPRPLPAERLRAATGADLVVGEMSGLEGAERYLADGDVLAFGDELIRAWRTPGHTRGCMSYLWRDRVFTGDALLIGGCGATDEEGSDPGALYDSLTRRLLALPDEILVYPAHDCSGRRVSCIGEEREANPKLKGTTRDEFIALQMGMPRAGRVDFVSVVTSR
ncbi:MAG: MBL fold metallo-hydrolase [Rhodocyclaceae bacterium]|nr:MBL fold metallo-hydrolase [Rhodocyclaceae bacterium]